MSSVEPESRSAVATAPPGSPCKALPVAAIETFRLTKRYGGDRGIEDLSMEVPEGEIFGFLGPNGAGKTTTIRTLVGLLHPTAGSARVFGLDIVSESVAIRARLGNLPGDFGFGAHNTGREALTLLARVRGVTSMKRAEELADRFQADLDRRLGKLSRGNRQKVGLILALFHRPELVVLDEPTSGLDPIMQEEFLALMREERDRGVTVFLSSHELDEVERVCDRVGIIREGRLVAVERVADLAGRMTHRVAVRFLRANETHLLRSCPGVSDLEVEGPIARFNVAGSLDPVVKALSGGTVEDLEVSGPTLEEVFLAYYRESADT